MKELRNYIRKLLEESIQKDLLEEDYDSIKEIKVLANDILLFSARENIEYVKRQIKDGKVEFLYPIKLIDVYQENPRKFPKLQEFLINTKILVEFAKGSDSSTARGSYTQLNEPEYDETRWRRIILYPREKFFEDITEKVQGKVDLEYREIYFTMWYAFHSTLEHELQHAYDDYRSKSKIFQNKRADKYSNKYYLPSGRENWPQDPKLANDKYTSYLKLQHEIWARFTQAIGETRFTTADFSKTKDGLDYISYSIKPLEKVIKDFKSSFHGWNIMSDDAKRRMLRRVSSYWHKEKEGLEEKNQDSINKSIEHENKRELAEIRKTVKQTLLEVSMGLDAYKKWKRNNVMVRGISSDSTLDVANGAGARFGDGLYMAPLSNKAMAKGYGKVYFVVNGKPKNPMVFKDTNLAEIWIQQHLIYNKYKNTREFNANTSIKDEMLKLGYDGIEIKGRETVNFTPENIQYYSTENGLIYYYERVIENKAIDENLNEEYPSNFSMDEFKSLKTFKERLDYCNSRLKKIGTGSSRTVYKIDDSKVLKLAKNKKGIVQNETEIDRGNDTYYSSILAQVFDSDDDGLWVEMELAIPINKYEFRRLTDFDIKDVGNYLINFQSETSGRGTVVHQQKPLVDRLVNDEFVQLLRDFVAGTDALAGDLGVATSYGLVKRNGHQELVVIDFGLTDKDYEKLYRESVVNENNDTNLWINNGILLIKGKPFEDGSQPLYAVHIIDLKQFERKKVDNTNGKPAKMAILDNTLYRIIVDNGMLRAAKVDWKNIGSLSRTFNFNGRQTHAVTLNNNKTPMHWDSLRYNNFPTLFKNVDLMSLPGIKWTL